MDLCKCYKHNKFVPPQDLSIASSHLCRRVKDPLLSRFLLVGDDSILEVLSDSSYHPVQQCSQPHFNL